ncbi:unnamed protein product, partial [Rotaria magnacalcarata]
MSTEPLLVPSTVRRRPERGNFWLMLIRQYRDGVLGCSSYGYQGLSWLSPSGAVRGVHTIRVFLKTRLWYTSNESK